MPTLFRIPGVSHLASFLAATFSFQANPTLRRYNDTLAQTFYHHGRLCASNQATVMVLVIVFVGMISYPGIVTSYNSSAYARQKTASTSVSSRNLSLSSWHIAEHHGTTSKPHSHRSHHNEGDLDAFWTNKVIAPTWTQDPAVLGRTLPSPEPLHYVAPVIINATDLFHVSQESTTDSKAPVPMPLTAADLLTFATQIQQRIKNIVVEYGTEENPQLQMDVGTGNSKESNKVPRLVSLRDICVLEPLVPVEEQSEGVGSRYSEGDRNCLVHSPRVDSQFHYDRDTIAAADLFGGFSFDDKVPSEQRQASLIIAYILRGDLGNRTQKDIKQKHDGHPQQTPAEGSSIKESLDVRRVWRLIFSKLQADIQAERAQQDPLSSSQGSHDAISSIASEGMMSIVADTPELNTISSIGEGASEGSSAYHFPAGDPALKFVVRIIPAPDTSRSVSLRLVSERNTQPKTNISAEYWLLGMAYFVMFLYISLSVGRVDLVKSKYGLGIAAVATVFVSLLMSIGLCSVFGVTLTLMPWEILPFMIIVVGVENINILVHAVVETSMDLPVKERVGRGLGTVGVSITMTLLAELCLLIIGAMTTIPAVQEFCTFAIAAVIMDYLLQMTFFITVISIDIRRLELSDLSTRPAVPYSRYPFGPRHPSTKTGHISSEVEAPRFGGGHSASGFFSSEAERSRHRRSDSTPSHHSDDEAKAGEKRVKANPKGRIFTSFLMVGVMAYLGYLYGTTNQSTARRHDPVTVSYWRILSLEDSSKFWSTVDPNHTGSYLEIVAPVVVTLMKPSNATRFGLCQDLPDVVDVEVCEVDQDMTAEPRTGAKFNESVMVQGQLDPRRPFKLLRDALVSICLFVIWLVRVFVIPSIIIAAAILLLLSYLLSPQRKLLVDLQWRFPFIVLPGDYQSKRKLMMEELLAQEARELGQDPRPCAPLPGAVETLHQRGHKTDIDQMDISSGDGLILTSSTDGIILLWSGVAGNGRELPLARLDESAGGVKSTKPKSRPVKLLKLASSGEFAVAGYGDGSVHVWRLDPDLTQSKGQWSDQVLRLMSTMQLVRRPESMTDVSKLRVSSAYFWECLSTEDPAFQTKHGVQLLVGYRDGQIWQWDLDRGGGKCVIESKHRGGIAELAMVELELKTRQELGLRSKTYLIAAGKDGGVQCWSNNRTRSEIQDTWALLWGYSGLGAGVSISVLSLDAEVPMVAAGCSTGAIKVWDLEQGNLIWTLSRGSLSSGGQGGSPSAKNLNMRFSQQLADNHQPSHQGAITKLCFHALELEDGITGEPAPRVWLVVSSSTDETVMVWMVEWEGLMCMPTHTGHPRLGIDPTTRRASTTLGAQAALGPANTHGNSYRGTDPPASLLRTRSFGSGESMVDSTSLSGHTDFLGMLSSSLPAPRLVGFMKQRGGKSMTVNNSCLYGVRRTESSAAVVGGHGDFPKRSHASVLDVTRPSSHFLRIRRKSDSHGLTQSTSNHGQTPSANSSPMRRGWELWEADLYQCIFKDPGVWGLDLTVRTINLQPHRPARSRSFSSDLGLNRRQSAKGIESQSSYESGAVIVSSNGSAMAVPVLVNQDASTLVGQETRPKLQRKPGSFTHQGDQRGYVFTTGLAKANLPQAIGSTPSSECGQPQFATQGSKASGAGWGNLPLDPQNNQCQPGSENGEPFLLPFVETKLVYALSRRTSRMHTIEHERETCQDGKEPEVRDIVVGFGNFIKIVRLQDDEDEDKEQSN